MNLNTISILALIGKTNKPKHCNKVGKSKRDKKRLKQINNYLEISHERNCQQVGTGSSSLLPQCAYEWGERTSSEKSDLYKNWRPPPLLDHFVGACCLNRGFAFQVEEVGAQSTYTRRHSRNYNSKVSARKNFWFLAIETDSEVVGGGEGRRYRGFESERAMMRGTKEVKRCLRVAVPKQETLSDFLYT
jgi:hypothetical protein